MKFKFLFVGILTTIFANAGEVNIAAAANTTYAFDEIKAEFQKSHPQTTLNVSLGASGALSTQIRNGAPFDIFMAADMKFADDLHKDGFATGAAKIYAKGKLAIFTVRNFTLDKNLEILKDNAIKTISIANPKTAPYGAATIEALKNAKIYDEISSKIVEAKSIGEALSQTMSAADVGFVAASAMYSPKMKDYSEEKNFILLDETLYEPIAQGIVVLKRAENSVEAKEFYDFILSEKGKEIFAKYGYSF